MAVSDVAVAVFALAILAVGISPAGAAPVEAAKGVASASPSLSVSGAPRGPYWETGFTAVYRTLLHNLHGPNSFFDTRFAYPSPIFRGVYLWDSAFISQVWKPWDADTAQDVDRAVLDHAKDGRLQHFTSQYSKSDYTQPPVMAWSVWEDYLWSGDKDFLARSYPVLKDYNRWLYENRRLAGGLFFWAHSYESGIDNSPRFGSADESFMTDMKSLAAVDLNSYMVRQNETLAAMAQELGETEDARHFTSQARELAELINQNLWDPETGYYYDRDMAADKLVKIRTIASLFPLFAGIPDQERAAVVRGHVMNPAEFNTPMPLPSVARDDPNFEKDCWRGPMWTNTAYLVIVGLERYGYDDDAAELSWKLADGIYKTYANTGKLVEFYDPDRFDFKELHRKRGNLYKLLTLGDKPQPNFVGWTGLVNNLVIEHLLGLRKERDKRWLKPSFPEAAAGTVFRLALPGDGVELEVEVRDQGATRGRIVTADGSREFSLAKGEAVAF
jgi:glycogen debranching enzyme